MAIEKIRNIADLSIAKVYYYCSFHDNIKEIYRS